MYWEKCKVDYFSTWSGEFVKITGSDNLNKSEYGIYLPRHNFDELLNRVPMNQALSGYPLDIKEFLICGYAPSKLSILLLEEENNQIAYVTNAVANSIVFYAMAYLNNKGVTPQEIKRLRIKYSFENLNADKFTPEEVKNSFINQSAFFLNLYKYMNENDRFEKFAENLEQQKRFKEVFSNYENFVALKTNYNRRIFHNKLECESMRHHYVEEQFHLNTGVFAEKTITDKPLYYSIDRKYLEAVRMRLCKVCGENTL
jgi:hypothetical protein